MEPGAKLPGGIYVAAVTPWGPGDTVDVAALWRHLEMLLDAGVNGICVGGSTGEFVRLSMDERDRLLRLALEIVAGRVPVLASAGHASLEGTLAVVRASRGAAAALVPPPYYFPYDQATLLEFYRRVAVSSDMPLLLYNIPQFSTAIEPATACRLLAGGGYAGIKDSGGQIEMLEALSRQRRHTPFSFFCGADQMLARALELGADGGLSGIAACAPEVYCALYRAFRAGDREGVARAHSLLLEFIERSAVFPAPIGIRLGLEARGIPVGPHAVPLSAELEEHARRFRHWLEDWLPRACALADCGMRIADSQAPS